MAPPPPARRSQSVAVVVLTLALVALALLWTVGGYLLYAYAPADFGEPPAATPSAPTAT